MKRHPSLQPLSREHHLVLAQARAIRWALSGRAGTPREACAGFLAVWKGTITQHFVAEELWILPLISRREDAERMRDEHEKLRVLAERLSHKESGAEPDRELLSRLARGLDDHIRWEERHLFPAIEASTPPEKLREAGEKLAAAEKTRLSASRGRSERRY
jgi:iron-sulfur cluster repair protein YtfE (RIC family)